MSNIRNIIALAALAASTPAVAQGHDHAGMNHAGMNHAGHGKSAARPAAKPAVAAGPGAVVKINGLICDFCVQALTKTFRSQAAVRAVAVDLDAKEVRLGFKPGMSLSDAQIGRLVKNAGYNVVAIQRRAA